MNNGNNTGNNTTTRSARRRHDWRPAHTALATHIRIGLLGLLVASQPALAAPQGGQIAAGQGSISAPNATTTLVQQQTNNLAINWQSFNVGAQETVRFEQPSASATVLNRILDQNPSQILGNIQANGRVFLMNPNGVLFGKGSRVEVAGLLASGLDMKVDDFMRGNYSLQAAAGREGGVVINRGLLQAATGGNITLVGGAVQNSGVIVANAGHINLAAGRAAVVDFDGDGLIKLQVDDKVLENSAGNVAAVSNSGTLQAEGGQILMTANAARDVFSSVVNNSGTIKAGRIDNSGGVVRLTGTGGATINSGTIDAAGRDAASTGGTVEVTGDNVGLFGASHIDASGAAGGGTVLVGGDLHGANTAVHNADQTYVASTATIKADATGAGNGGKVVVWSDKLTRYYGNISARGGAPGGNGGFVEVSGKQYLDFHGGVDLSAPLGTGGTLLLDPLDIVLDNTVQAAPTNQTAGTPDVAFADAPAAGTTTIEIADVTGFDQLYLQATHDITLNNNLTMGAGNSVKFEAGNNININANLTVSGAGTVGLTADADFSAGGGAASDGVGAITRGGAGNTISLGTGLLTLQAGSGITATTSADTVSVANSTSGNVSLTEANAVTVNGISNANGDVALNAGGTVTLAGNVTAGTGATAVNITTTSGDINRNSGTIASTGTVTLNAAGGIGIAGAVNTNLSGTGSLALTTGGNSAAGNISLVESGALNTSAVTFTTKSTGGSPTNQQAVSLTAAGLTVGGSIGNSTDNLSLIASGSNDITGGAGTLTAKGLTLNAGGGIGAGTAVDTAATTVSATTAGVGSAGNITLSKSGVLATSAFTFSTDASAQTIDLQGGSVSIDAALNMGTDNLVLRSTAGSITDGTAGAGGFMITANSLGVDAVGGNIDVNSTVGTVAATTDTSTLRIDNTGALAVGIVGGVTGISTVTGGNVTLTSTGTVSVNQNISATAGSQVSIATTGGTSNIDGGGGTIASDNKITLNAGGGIGIGGAVATNLSGTGTLALTTAGSGSAGNITLSETGALNTNRITTLSTGGTAQAIDLTAASWTTTGSLGNATDSLTLRAAGAGTITGGAGTLTGSTVSLNSGGFIGASGTEVKTDAGTLAFTGAGAGDVYLIEANGANLSGTTGSGAINVKSTTGNLTVNGAIATTGDVTLNAVVGSLARTAGTVSGNLVTLTAGGANGAVGASGAAIATDAATIAFTANGTGDVYISEANGANISGTAGTGNIDIRNATGNLTVTAPMSTGGSGNLTLDTGTGTLTTNAGAKLQTANGDITLIADTLALGDTVTNTGSGNINLAPSSTNQSIGINDATGAYNITLAELQTLLSTSGTVTIGKSGGTGAVNVASLGNVDLTVPAYNLAIRGGDITFNDNATTGGITLANNKTVTLTGNNIISNSGFTHVTVGGASGTLIINAALDAGTTSSFLRSDVSKAQFNTGGNVVLLNNGALDLQTSSVGGNLFLGTNNGDMTDSGTVTVSGDLFAQAVSGAITLNQLDVSGNMALLSAAGQNATVVNASDIKFGTVWSLDTAVGGVLSATATTGTVTQTSGITSSGNAIFTANGSGGAITLTDINNSFGGSVALNSVGTASIYDSTALDLGTSSVNALIATTSAAGGITQSGTLTVNTTSNVNAGANTITLTDANNDFGGAVTLTGTTTQITDKNALTLGTLATGDLTAISTGALNLGQGTVTGALVATSNGGTVTQAGPLTVTGTSNVNAGANIITLADANNDFGGAVTLTGTTTQITDKNALTLGTLATGDLTAISTGALNLGQGTVTGSLVATSNGGTVTQAGPLTVTGTSNVNAGANTITLADANNDFGGAVTLTGTTTQITDKNALTLGTLATGDLTAISTGALNLGQGTVTGALVATSNGGAVTQAGPLTVAGTSTVNAGANTITLADANNDFGGAVTLNNSGGNAVALTDKNALTLVNGSVGGNLTVTSGGALTQTGNLVAGTSGSGAIVINSAAGGITQSGNISTSSGPITLTTTGGDYDQNGNITTGNGAVTVTSTTGSINMAGAAVTTSGAQSIDYSAVNGSVALGHLDAGTGVSGGTVTVIASVTTGLISNAGLPGIPSTTNPNITGSTVNLTAKNIGQSLLSPLWLQAQTAVNLTTNETAYIDGGYNLSGPGSIVNIIGTGSFFVPSTVFVDASKGQTVKVEDLGYIDPSLFQDLSLFGIVAPGIKLPAGQEEEQTGMYLPLDKAARRYARTEPTTTGKGSYDKVSYNWGPVRVSVTSF